MEIALRSGKKIPHIGLLLQINFIAQYKRETPLSIGVPFHLTCLIISFLTHRNTLGCRHQFHRTSRFRVRSHHVDGLHAVEKMGVKGSVLTINTSLNTRAARISRCIGIQVNLGSSQKATHFPSSASACFASEKFGFKRKASSYCAFVPMRARQIFPPRFRVGGLSFVSSFVIFPA